MRTANDEWLRAVDQFIHLSNYRVVSPRGLKCYEIPEPFTVKVDPYYPLVTIKDRKLNYKFAAAEALWITTGRNDLAYLAQVNQNMAAYSDDGVTLNGAYGPRILDQLDYVVDKLVEDEDTRQAVLTIWDRNPGPSKDIPCTIAMNFYIRDRRLACSVFMRSSDVFLGLPYDIFSFSMVMRLVLEHFTKKSLRVGAGYLLGPLFITATSSHLYVKDIERVSFAQQLGHTFDLHVKLEEKFFNTTTYSVAAAYLHQIMAGDYV